MNSHSATGCQQWGVEPRRKRTAWWTPPGRKRAYDVRVETGLVLDDHRERRSTVSRASSSPVRWSRFEGSTPGRDALGVTRSQVILQAVEQALEEDSAWSPAFLKAIATQRPELDEAADEMMKAIRSHRSRNVAPRL